MLLVLVGLAAACGGNGGGGGEVAAVPADGGDAGGSGDDGGSDGGGSDGGGDDGNEDNPPVTLEPGQVETTEGVVEGTVEGSLLVFRGIRYAAAPLGNLRFSPPQPPDAFDDVQVADTFGSNCVQPQGNHTIGAEDCLFLNVWAHNDDAVRPVMVYMHPGAANGVGGDLSSIAPDDLAADGDIIVVNFNRRVGVMGYLALDELILESDRQTAGNYGALDVIAALQWVQENIAGFNGDPDRVMLSGTSAGGLTSCAVLGAPEAAGLFDAVAIQSAPCSPVIMQKLTDQVAFDSRFPPAVETHRDLLARVGCDAAADVPGCLRSLPAEDLVLAGVAEETAKSWMVFAPLLDGVVVQQEIRAALENMVVGDIPVIVGVTGNEVGNQFAALDLPDDASYRDYLATRFPDPIDDALYDLYPTIEYPTPKDAFLSLWSDLAYSCAAQRLALAGVTGAPSYLYEITRGFDSGPFAGEGAYHAIDIAYLFGNFDAYGVTPDAQSLAIRDAMRAAWTGLAGDPTSAPPISTEGTVLWPVYQELDATYAEFGETITGKTGHRDYRCADLFALFG
jgi:para-nitrobenzyl esterase